MDTSDHAAASDPQAEAAQQLKSLRLELVGPAVTVQGVVALLRQIDPELVAGLPESVSHEEFEQLIDWLDAAGHDLRALVDKLALTGNAN